MANDPSVHDLLTPEHQKALRSEYWTERAAWAVMGLIVSAALLGAFGPGLLSNRSRTTPDGSLGIEYSAIVRYQAPSTLVIRTLREPSSAGPVRLVLSRTLADRSELKQLTPPPLRVEAGGQTTVVSFEPAALAPRQPITYRFEHEDYGPIEFDVGLAGGQSVRVWQLVLP